MQAILLTSSLLLVAAMLGSLVWLCRMREQTAEAVALDAQDEL
jgi:hypothetical protein